MSLSPRQCVIMYLIPELKKSDSIKTKAQVFSEQTRNSYCIQTVFKTV